MFTPLGGKPVCFGKKGTMPSDMSILNLLGPGSGNGIIGRGAIGSGGNVGTIGTIGLVSFGMRSTAAFTIAKPIGTTNKVGNVADKSRIKPILHLFPWLQDMQAPL